MNNEIKIDNVYYGWFVRRIKSLDSDQTFYELEHEKTKAKYVHIESKDKNNCFAVTFKTKPSDSTGVAHILEHTVLTGSEKYPVRDPFFSMLKRSLQTYMNAFTSEDWTAYPFSTSNKKDFYNLLSIYLDAAFFPTISELNFRQEGWRYDFDTQGNLEYKGVVFNEMKGSMSSPDRIMAEAIKKSLFEKSSYKYNSGGDPKEITNLSHEDLKKFHAKFYHPSNSYFFSFGNLPLFQTLEKVENLALSKFSKQETDSNFILEPKRQKQEELVEEYPIAENENINKKWQACVNWLLCPLENSFEVMSLELLFDILMGNPAAPLRKKMIESGIGSDLSDDSGFNTEFRDTVFSIGLKDIEEKDLPSVKELIFETLLNVKDGGVDIKQIEAVIQKQEIFKKEITNSPYPYGLKRWLEVVGPWIHGGDVFDLFDYEKDLKELKAQVQKGGFFESLIDKYLLQNKHVSFVVLKPSQDFQKMQLEEESKRLKTAQKKLTDIDIEKIKIEALDLNVLQTSEEDLSVLPSVKLEDIDCNLEKIVAPKIYNKNVFEYNINTNGLVYYNFLFNLNVLSEEEIKYLPLICFLLPRMGTKKRTYEELASFLELHTGGVNFSCFASLNKKNNNLVFNLIGRGKSLDSKKDKLLKIIKEIITCYDFSNLDLLKRFLLELQSRKKTQLVQNGHIYAITLAESVFGQAQKIEEDINGLSQLEFLKDLSNQDLDAVYKKIVLILEKVFTSNYKFVALGDEISSEQVDFDFKKNVKLDSVVLEDGDKESVSGKIYKKIPSAVSFVAASIKIEDISIKERASLFVLSKLLARGFLHNEIRERGGAYGGFARFSYITDIFSFGSYRDPHVKRTLGVYEKAKDYIEKAKIDQQMLEEAIIMSFAELDKAKTPKEQVLSDFFDNHIGYDYGLRQKFRNSILEVTVDDIKSVSNRFLKGNISEMSVAVLGPQR